MAPTQSYRRAFYPHTRPQAGALPFLRRLRHRLARQRRYRLERHREHHPAGTRPAQRPGGPPSADPDSLSLDELRALALLRKPLGAKLAEDRMKVGIANPDQISDQGRTLDILAAIADVSHDTIREAARAGALIDTPAH